LFFGGMMLFIQWSFGGVMLLMLLTQWPFGDVVLHIFSEFRDLLVPVACILLLHVASPGQIIASVYLLH
jgi:hypothetical protein